MKHILDLDRRNTDPITVAVLQLLALRFSSFRHSSLVMQGGEEDLYLGDVFTVCANI